MAKELESAKHAKNVPEQSDKCPWGAKKAYSLFLNFASFACFADSCFDFTFLKTGHGYYFDEYPVSHK